MGESREMRRRAAGALAVVAIVAAAVLAFAGNPIPVVVAAAEEVLPEANTDGVLAYACLTAGGTYDICVTNPATGDFANVTNTGGLNETDPTWSPDGRAILAVSWASGGNNNQPQAPGDGELVRIDVTDPTNPGPIRGTGIQGFAPDWGPDGDLVFSRFSYPPPYHNRAPIEVVFTRYSEIWERFDSQRTVLSPGGNMWSDASWSPDGKSVVTSFRKGQPFDSTAPAWGELFRLPPAAWPAPRSLNLIVGNDSGPAVSETRRSGNGYLEGDVNPDGNLIAHVQCTVLQLTGNCSSASRQLAVMSVGGVDQPGLATLTDAGENARNPAWSPNGSDIAYGSSAGIRIYDTTTGARSSVARSLPGDMQPSWRPKAERNDGAFTAGDDGLFKRAFTEANNVNIVVTDVPTDAVAVRSCVFDASAITEPLPPDLGCIDQLAPAPFRVVGAVADPSGVGLSFGQLPPARYRAVVEFEGSTRRLTTNEFTVTCFGGSCDVFPRLAIAASLDTFADRLEDVALVVEASCMWAQYTAKILSTAKTFAGALASGNPTRAVVQLALDAEMSYLTGKGVELAAKLYGIEIAKDIVSGGKTYNSNVAARNAAQEAYYNASDPGDKVIQGEKGHSCGQEAQSRRGERDRKDVCRRGDG